MPSERDISRDLADREQGQCEVKTPVGFIDVLTPSVLYEVKEISGWKGALGQVLTYGRYYPNHKLKLYLYGSARGAQKQLIKEHCAKHGVSVVWHREPQDAQPPRPPKVVPPIPDSLKLVVSAFDASYQVKASTTVNLLIPTAFTPQDVLETYMDEALAVFNDLLDNELTLTLSSRFAGQQQIFTRTRASVQGKPVFCRFNITLLTARRLTFRVSLPGMRYGFPSGMRRIPNANHAAITIIPEINRLRALIFHPTFPWVSQLQERATTIANASYAIVKR